MTYHPASLVELLRWRANNQPGKLAYRFLGDGENEEFLFTYGELDKQARSIAAKLQSVAHAGDRALIIFPPGLDFIAAYFGCLYAKILAIPAYPPHPARLERNLSIILRIAADAKPTVALLSSSLLEVINAQPATGAALNNITLLATDHLLIDDWAGQWEESKIGLNDLAFLQYTSGSTTAPKGVMVSHGNLLHNLEQIGKCFQVSDATNSVSWMPPYHDMGLIGGILQPLYSGIPVTLIPHMIFLQRPIRWLQTISRFQATMSGGPNFAYDLCLKKIKPEQRDLLDLSRWETAFNGAETVYHQTLEQFAEYFAPCGFRREAFLPCYGLAESTLLVAGGLKGREPMTLNLVNTALEQNLVKISSDKREDTRTLVCCGQNISSHDVRIVHMETMTPCPEDEIGEIWVNSPSVAGGYWNNPSKTASTFRARLANSNEGPFLRTGDLGFLHGSEFYITGRIKNLIISEGKNHYPNDIERTVESSHSVIRSAGSAVFSVCSDGKENIIVLIELEHKLEVQPGEVFKAIREAVSIHHGLQISDIKLLKPGGIPRTTSGKIRHFLCKEYYLNGSLKEIK